MGSVKISSSYILERGVERVDIDTSKCALAIFLKKGVVTKTKLVKLSQENNVSLICDSCKFNGSKDIYIFGFDDRREIIIESDGRDWRIAQ
jgi:phospholipid N-methyltransferase